MSKILKFNLILVLGGMIVIFVLDRALSIIDISAHGAFFVIFYALFITGLTIGNFLMMLVSLFRKDGQFKFYLLSLLLVLLIGFPLCLVSGSLFS